MSQFVVDGILGGDTPVIFDVNIGAYSFHDQAMLDRRNSPTDDYDLKAFIDTGSRQCLITPGLFSDSHFGSQPLVEIMENVEGIGQRCRGQLMAVTFSSKGRSKKIEVPVFEMRMGLPDGCMIIGRTLLNQAVLTYDGPNRKVTLTFVDSSPVKL